MEIVTKERIQTLSDGIFAIVATLLILEIKVPHIEDKTSIEELITAFQIILPKLVSWIISFAVIFVIYLNHHRLLNQVEHVSTRLFWLNAYLLLFVTLIPFPTALMGEYPNNPLAVSTYGIVMMLMALGFIFMRGHLSRNKELLSPNVDYVAFGITSRKSLFAGPVINLIGAASAWLNPAIAFLCYALVPMYFLFARSSKSQSEERVPTRSD